MIDDRPSTIIRWLGTNTPLPHDLGYDGFEPAITRAANGDLVMLFPTCLDGGDPAGSILVTRSTDVGRTWSPPTPLRPPRPAFPGGLSIAVGTTTLTDGIILAPFTEASAEHRWLNRSSELFVARSVDHGKTWSNLQEPAVIDTPWQTRFAYGRIVDLGDRLLLPFWGSTDLPDNWRRMPAALRSGVLASDDAGASWRQFSVIAHDPWISPRFSAEPMAMGPNETSVVRLPDGRLLAVFRYEKHREPSGVPLYAAWSDDGGSTWSAPRMMPIEGASPSLHWHSSGVLLLGCRNTSASIPDRGGSLALRASEDRGLTWGEPTFVFGPTGPSPNNFEGSYPDFLEIGDVDLLVPFMHRPRDGRFTVAMATVRLDRASPSATRGQAASGSISVLRADHAGLPLYAASTVLDADPTPTVRAATELVAGHFELPVAGVRLERNGSPLGDDDSVAPGDQLVAGTVSPGEESAPRLGYRDHDHDPAVGPCYGWDSLSGPGLWIGSRDRTLGLQRDDEHRASTISLELESGTGLPDFDVTVWVSDDNLAYTEAPRALWRCRQMSGTRAVVTIDPSPSPWIKVTCTNERILVHSVGYLS